jgi:hypothetical protein
MRWLFIFILLIPVVANAQDCQVGWDTTSGTTATTIQDAMKGACWTSPCTGTYDSLHFYQDGGGTGGAKTCVFAIYQVQDDEGPTAWNSPFDGVDTLVLILCTDTVTYNTQDGWLAFHIGGPYEAPTITSGVGYAVVGVAETSNRACGMWHKEATGYYTIYNNDIGFVDAWPDSLTAYTPGHAFTGNRWRQVSFFVTEVATGNSQVIIIGDNGQYNLNLEKANEKALYNVLVACAMGR